MLDAGTYYLVLNAQCLKNMKNLFMIFCLLCSTVGMSQVAINIDGTTPDNSAMLDIKSNNKGILVPRMTQTVRNAIVSPATGLMIYQSDNTPGFYYNSGTSGSPNWIMVGSGSFSLPYMGSISIGTQAFQVTNTGSGDGIIGYSSSSVGKGIYGFATSSTGTNYGVYGLSSSGSGCGVYGSGQKGVYGYSYYGYGVDGLGVHGIHGETNISGGWGVSGNSTFATGGGVIGINSSAGGIGVKGDATSTSGLCKGVFGQSVSYEGYGVYGSNTSTTGTARGVYGISTSITGVGVEGFASGAAGWGIGVKGESQWLGGTGLSGLATSSTGENFGVYGETWSSNGYSGYFYGGMFYVSGFTGIGTEAPDCSLHIKAPDNASRNMLRIEDNSGNTKILMRQNSNGSGGFYVYNAAEENTIFLYGEGSSFINSGYLGIGTSSPTQLLDVNGNARFRAVGSGGYSAPLNITSDGILTTSTSDIRLKENVRTLENSLDKVMHLRGVSFTWKENPGMGTRIGFVAQEVEYVYPELVFTNEVDGYKGVNYAEFSAVLVEAMKELKSEVNRLEAENDQLKSRLQEIEILLQQIAK